MADKPGIRQAAEWLLEQTADVREALRERAAAEAAQLLESARDRLGNAAGYVEDVTGRAADHHQSQAATHADQRDDARLRAIWPSIGGLLGHGPSAAKADALLNQADAHHKASTEHDLAQLMLSAVNLGAHWIREQTQGIDQEPAGAIEAPHEPPAA